MGPNQNRYLNDEYRTSIEELVEPHPQRTVEQAVESFIQECAEIDSADDDDLDMPTIRRLAYQRVSEDIGE